jgi:hypothetical protein
VLLSTGIAFIAGTLGADLAVAGCTMNDSQPDSGTLTLEFVRPSTKNSDRNDYRLSGTIKWNDQDDLSCFSAREDKIGWAYEHNLTYQQGFHRKIWSPDLSGLSDGDPYIDTGAGDEDDRTDLTFGLFRPEALKAGVDYRFAYSLFLPNEPEKGVHSMYLAGQVLERTCPWVNPWCVGWKGPGDEEPFIGVIRTFSVKGKTCWSWRKDKSPEPCGPPSKPAPGPAPPVASPPPTTPPGTPPPTPRPPVGNPPPQVPSTWSEQQGSLGANTFLNPYNASGMGQKIQPYQWVQVACKLYAPQIVSSNPDGYWYRISSPPWSNAYYAVANTFWNGDVPGQKPYVHNTDWAVPNC